MNRRVGVIRQLSTLSGLLILSSALLADTIGVRAPVVEQEIPASWAKNCVEGSEGSDTLCYTKANGQIASASYVAIVLITMLESGRRTLRITVPLGMQLREGAWLQIDEYNPIYAPFLICVELGCAAEYDAPDELLSQLKQGKKISLLVTSYDGQPVKLAFPLDGFSDAYSKPEGDERKE
jgi:invasion protein IalB